METNFAQNNFNNQSKKSINLIDLFFYLLSKWKWYIISLMVFVGYYYYQYSKAPYYYRASQTVMIKTSSNTLSANRIASRAGNVFNSVNVNSEILQLKSKELMRKTINETKADYSFSYRNGLRNIELFDESPFVVELQNINDDDYL